jgi:hypothetical protein
MITIDGPNFQDFQEAEVPRLPEESEPIETKYGTCVVTLVEALPASDHFRRQSDLPVVLALVVETGRAGFVQRRLLLFQPR